MRQMSIVMLVVGRVDDAAVTVIGVFAETHIRNNDPFWRGILDRPNRAGNYAIWTVVLGSKGILLAGNTEKHHCWNIQRRNLPRFGGEFVRRPAELPRHRPDRLLLILTIGYK